METEENSKHRLAGTFAESFLRCAELFTAWFIRRGCSYNSEVQEGLFASFTRGIKSVHRWGEMNIIVLLPSAQLILFTMLAKEVGKVDSHYKG